MNSDIVFPCTACLKEIHCSGDQAAQQIVCPHCQERNIVPVCFEEDVPEPSAPITALQSLPTELVPTAQVDTAYANETVVAGDSTAVSKPSVWKRPRAIVAMTAVALVMILVLVTAGRETATMSSSGAPLASPAPPTAHENATAPVQPVAQASRPVAPIPRTKPGDRATVPVKDGGLRLLPQAAGISRAVHGRWVFGGGGRWLLVYSSGMPTIDVVDLHEERVLASINVGAEIADMSAGKSLMAVVGKDGSLRLLHLPDGGDTGIIVPVPAGKRVAAVHMGQMSDERLLLRLKNDREEISHECRSGSAFADIIWSNSDGSVKGIDSWCEYVLLSCWSVHMPTGMLKAERELGPYVLSSESVQSIHTPFGVDHRARQDPELISAHEAEPNSGFLISSPGLQAGLKFKAGAVTRFEDGPTATPIIRIPGKSQFVWHLPDVGKLCVWHATELGVMQLGFVDLPPVAPPSNLGIRLTRGGQDSARLPLMSSGQVWRLVAGPKGLAVDGQGQCTWKGSDEVALGRYEAKLEIAAPDRSVQTVMLTVGLCESLPTRGQSVERFTAILPGRAAAWMVDIGACASRSVDLGFRDTGKQWMVDSKSLTMVVLDMSGEFTLIDLVKGKLATWIIPEAASANMGWIHAGNLTVLLMPSASRVNGRLVVDTLLVADWTTRKTRLIKISNSDGLPQHSGNRLHLDPSGKRLLRIYPAPGSCPLHEIDLATGSVSLHEVYLSNLYCIDGDDIVTMVGTEMFEMLLPKMPWQHSVALPKSTDYDRTLMRFTRVESTYKVTRVQPVPSRFGMVSQGLVNGIHCFVGEKAGNMHFFKKSNLLLYGSGNIDMTMPENHFASMRFSAPAAKPVVGACAYGDDRIGYVFRQQEQPAEFDQIAEFATASVDAATGRCMARGTLRSDLDGMQLLGIAGDRHFFICQSGSPHTFVVACDAVQDKVQAEPAPTETEPVDAAVTVAMVEAKGVGIGSAFCVRSESGRSIFASNCHVAGSYDPAMDYHLRLAGGTAEQRRLPAKLIALSYANDLALLEVAVEAKAARWRSRDAGDLRQGAPLTLIGFPLTDDLAVAGGRLRETASTATHIATFGTELLFAGVVSPGNSGGPALDQGGCVVGVVRARSLVGDVGWAVRADKLQSMLTSSFSNPRVGRRRTDDAIWPLVVRVQVLGAAPTQMQARILFNWGSGGLDRKPYLDRTDPLGPAIGRLRKLADKINERSSPSIEGGETYPAQPVGGGVWEAVIPAGKFTFFDASNLMTLRFESTRVDGSVENSPWLTTRIARKVDALLEADGSTSSLNDQGDLGLLKPPGFIDICHLDGDVINAQRCGEGRYLALQLAPSQEVALYDMTGGRVVRRFAPTGSESLCAAGGWLLAMPEPSGAIRLHDLRQPDSPPRLLPPADLGRQVAISLDDAGMELRTRSIMTCSREVRMTTSRINLGTGKVEEREFSHCEDRDLGPAWFIDPYAPFARMPVVTGQNHAAISGLTTFLPDMARFTPDSGELLRPDGASKLARGMLIASPDGKDLMLWKDDFSLTLLDSHGRNPRPVGMFPLLMSASFRGDLPSDGSLRIRQSLWLDRGASQVTCIPPDLPRMVIRWRIKP